MRLRLWTAAPALLAGLALATASRQAHAAPTDQDKALASSLFDQARALLGDGKVADACRKLEESRRLDPLPGTLLNLAVCHEKEGLLASAFAEFREARAMAERDNRPDRITLADEHMHAMEPKISALVITVDPGADVPGLTITRDATPIGRATWGARIPMDPGEHVVEASAPNKKPWKTTVTVLVDGNVQTVSVKALEDATPAPPPVVAAAVDAHGPSSPPDAGPSPKGLSSQRIGALVSGGAGVVALGVGSYFGIRAIDDHNASNAPGNVSLNNDAKLSADTSTATMIVGAAGLAVGAFLWFWVPRPSTEAKAVTLLPSFAPGRGSLDVAGRF
jgi:hypothetical protein